MLQPSKNPFIDTLRAVINDVKWFLFLLLLTMWGFCMSFYILFRRDQTKEVHTPSNPDNECVAAACDDPAAYINLFQIVPRGCFGGSHCHLYQAVWVGTVPVLLL